MLGEGSIGTRGLLIVKAALQNAQVDYLPSSVESQPCAVEMLQGGEVDCQLGIDENVNSDEVTNEHGSAVAHSISHLVDYSSTDESSIVCPSVSDDDEVGSPLIPLIERFVPVEFGAKRKVRDDSASDADVNFLVTDPLSSILHATDSLSDDEGTVEDQPSTVESQPGTHENVHSDKPKNVLEDDEVYSLSADEGHDKMVTVYSKTLHGKGKDRKLPCYFCEKFVFHMSRHLRTMHASEPPVAAVLATAGSVKRLRMKQLSNMGVYKHNSNVLKNGDGVLIVCRSPKKITHRPEDFLPCTFCLAMYVKRELYRHCRACKFRPDAAPLKGFVASGRALLLGSTAAAGVYAELNEHVVPRMRLDRCTQVATGDSLIMQYGSVLLHKLGQKRVLDVSARMRELARLVIRLQHSGNGPVRLSDFLDRNGFDQVVEAVEVEGRAFMHDKGRRLYKSPAFVLKVGNSLLKCAHLKRGKALRNGDDVSLTQAEDFIKLHNNEFTDKLSALAHASLRIKGNSLSEYPDEQDLRTLKLYQKAQICSLVSQLSNHPCDYLWRELAEVTLSRLLVFNARRGSEGGELTVEEYKQATSDLDPAISAGFTDVERQLLTRYTCNFTEYVNKGSRY